MAAALESYVTESVAILLVVAALAVLVSLAARRAGVGRALGPIELLARLPLEPRRSVYVVRVADRLLIIGSSEAGLVKLGELPKGALPPGALPERTFASLLDGVWRGASTGRGHDRRAADPSVPGESSAVVSMAGGSSAGKPIAGDSALAGAVSGGAASGAAAEAGRAADLPPPPRSGAPS